LTDISEPLVELFLPPEAERTGAAVLVCPGGGLQRLAYEHEGLEVADWLASEGVVALVLKYRVPAPVEAGLADAQRAMGLVRQRAGEWKIDPGSVGVLGFSAGGEIAAWLAAHHSDRVYEPVDGTDAIACRPDFVGLVYPGGLLDNHAGGGLKDGIARGVGSGSPPVFIAHAFDDRCEDSLVLALALKRAAVPCELHVYAGGAHGFGARPTGDASDGWRADFLAWAASGGHLDPAALRRWCAQAAEAIRSGRPVPALGDHLASPTLEDAYSAQRRLFHRDLGGTLPAGFKVAAVSAAAQERLGLEGPLTGLLHRNGALKAADRPVVASPPGTQVMVETEIGYVISVDINYAVLNDTQAAGAVSAILPVVELPVDYGDRMKSRSAADLVATNIGSWSYILGEERPVGSLDPDAVVVHLHRDGTALHTSSGAAAAGGQWGNLRKAINQIVSNGYTLRAGQVIIGGALGPVQPGAAGRYRADFGALGTVEFQIE
jgi:2-keto-4-pentenoate hydratase/acetyl esterase/lipase